MSADLVTWLRAVLDEDEAAEHRKRKWGPDTFTKRCPRCHMRVEEIEGTFHSPGATLLPCRDELTREEWETFVDAQPAPDEFRLAVIASTRALLKWHAPTGSRDPITCGLCPHGRAIHPNDGACVDRDCDCQGFDDDRELMYPEAARLCGFCGPGDNWPARDPEDFPHALWPCKHVRLLAAPFASRAGFVPSWLD